MKVGDYVRTNYGIKQIYEIDNNKTVWKYKFKLKKQDGDGCIDLGCFSDSDVIKSSPNIIDLIKEHDLLRLYDVEYGEEYIAEVVIDSVDMLSVSNYDCDNFLHLVQELMTNEHIKLISIVTSEQFSQMEYRIGD